jgi:hypothetical protein
MSHPLLRNPIPLPVWAGHWTTGAVIPCEWHPFVIRAMPYMTTEQQIILRNMNERENARFFIDRQRHESLN